MFLFEDSFLLNTRFNENNSQKIYLLLFFVILAQRKWRIFQFMSKRKQKSLSVVSRRNMTVVPPVLNQNRKLCSSTKFWKTSPTLSSSTCSTSQSYQWGAQDVLQFCPSNICCWRSIRMVEKESVSLPSYCSCCKTAISYSCNKYPFGTTLVVRRQTRYSKSLLFFLWNNL
jgi:hypothetical protein